jgi:hypothetical protein
MAIVPPELVVGIELPTALDATVPLMATGTFELRVPAEIVKVAEAMDPFGMVVVLSPKSRHVVDPLELEHAKLFDGVTAGSATTVTLVTSAVG